MRSSGPATKPSPKFMPGRAFCGAQTKGPGFMWDSGKRSQCYYVLAAELRAVLERWWPVSILGPPDLIWCRSGLGLGFGEIFASLFQT